MIIIRRSIGSEARYSSATDDVPSGTVADRLIIYFISLVILISLVSISNISDSYFHLILSCRIGAIA